MSTAHEQWLQRRDALRVQFPIGATVETVPDCFGLESGEGLACVDNHDGREPVRGVVTGHSASRVEFDEADGTGWTMQPESLRVVALSKLEVLEERRRIIAASYRAICAEIKAMRAEVQS